MDQQSTRETTDNERGLVRKIGKLALVPATIPLAVRARHEEIGLRRPHLAYRLATAGELIKLDALIIAGVGAYKVGEKIIEYFF